MESATADKTQVLSGINELQKKQLENKGLLEFYKAKGMRVTKNAN